MRTAIIVLLAAAALFSGIVLLGLTPMGPSGTLQPQQTTEPAQPTGPQIVRIEFPKEISADGEPVTGYVLFQAPTGTLTQAEFEVIEAEFFPRSALIPKSKT